jgi:acyl-CoA thioester hydrolase
MLAPAQRTSGIESTGILDRMHFGFFGEHQTFTVVRDRAPALQSQRPLRRTGEAMLRGYPVIVDVVVRWGDMDSLGHVNHTLYLQYFETARVEYLVGLGMEPPGPRWQEYGLILASVNCRYKVPVTYPDTLSAYSHRWQRVAAEGDAMVVSYDYVAGRRTSLHSDLKSAILAVEKREIPPLPRQLRTPRDPE